ncbi:MAG: FG-GAP-like repeat-containing protein [Candidatus Electryonea clarkiae]|nr:FG-GAP-like repeat-containing protein [Candidatus Electryonea clarkiae]MDP8287335.1 FG-GAP-like repeat-containing protein [Candidatus Electryonea clarkiae]
MKENDSITFAIFIILILTTSTTFSQIRFEEHAITFDLEGAWPICVEDLDNDDDFDIIGFGYDGYVMSWFENDGNHQFEQHVIDDSTNLNYCYTMDVKDFDDDGDIDAVIGIAWGDYVIFYENDGDGNFTREVINDELRATVLDIQGIDMDDDGDYDLIVSTSRGLYWFENDGDANFTEIHEIINESVHRRVAYAVDLDNDGDQDIIHGRISRDIEPHTIQWLENLGNQEFVTHFVGNFFGVKTISVADCNNDGYPDILSAGYDVWGADAEFGWWENDVNQEFTYHLLAENIRIIFDLNGSDLDLDGDVDILVASTWDGEITWWENETNVNEETVYTEHLLADDVNSPSFVLSEDMDFDGDLDVIASLRFDDAILWWENYTIHDRPYPFSLMRPWNGHTFEDIPCLFTWSTAAGTHENGEISYTFYYAHDSLFTELGDTAFVSIVSDTGVMINDFNENVTYWWKVLAEDEQGGQTWSSQTRSFDFNWVPTMRPRGLTAQLDSLTGLVSMSWRAAENTGIPAFRGYVIYRNETALDTIDEAAYQDQLEEGGTYTYTVAAVFRYGETEHSNAVNITWNSENVPGDHIGALPERFEITAIYPNPFNTSLTTVIALPRTSYLHITIFNIYGQNVATIINGNSPAGYHQFTFDASDLSSGIYFIHASVPSKMNDVRKVVLVR